MEISFDEKEELITYNSLILSILNLFQKKSIIIFEYIYNVGKFTYHII